jgi:iron complex outermembrane receptor protein
MTVKASRIQLNENRVALWVIAAGLAGTSFSSGAIAQQAPGVPQASAEPQTASPSDVNAPPDTQLEAIVVTAQRREESLQQVPITVTAITANALQAQGIRTAADLGVATPGVTITRTLGTPQVYIRGVGTQNGATGDESSNAVYYDGVYIAAMPAGFMSFNNIERVEVLKGPQGTLFGRNATGGLIQIISRPPSFQPLLDAELSYGNYDSITGDLYASTGLSDTLAADLALHFDDQGRGFGINRFTGNEAYKSRSFALRSSLLWQIDGTFQIRVAGDYSDYRESMSTSRQIVPGAVGFGGTLNVGGFYDINSEIDPYNRGSSYGGSVTVRKDFDGVSLVSISALRQYDSYFLADQDSTPLFLSIGAPEGSVRQFSQELQLHSPSASRIKWIVGAYYFTADADQVLSFTGSSQAALGGYLDRYGSMDTRSIAGYGQVTVPLGDSTDITGGARYTSDHRSLVARDETGIGVRNVINTGRTWSQPTWRVAINQHIGQDSLLYASYSRGFKSGIYNLNNTTNPAVQPEEIDAYEVGTKNDFLNHTLRFNLAGFYYDYRNLQLVVRTAGTSQIFNAASAEVYGLDAEFLAIPVRGLTLRANANLLHARYQDFPNAPGTLPSPATCATNPPSELPGPRTGANTTCPIDASGNTMIRSPRLTLTAGAAYSFDTNAGRFTLDASYYHNSGFFFEPDNRIQQEAYDVVNGQLSWTSRNGHYRVRLWVRNLFDEQYYAAFSTSLGDAGTAGAPRTFGVSFGVHFN